MQLIELPVDATPGQQFLVCPDFTQLRFVHNDDAGGALNRRKAVRDHDRCPVQNEAVQSLPDAQLGLRVDARSRFIQDENARIMSKCAGEADQLLLPGREAVSAFADRSAEAFGKFVDKIKKIDPLG